jgi:hypothetical protein
VTFNVVGNAGPLAGMALPLGVLPMVLSSVLNGASEQLIPESATEPIDLRGCGVKHHALSSQEDSRYPPGGIGEQQ